MPRARQLIHLVVVGPQQLVAGARAAGAGQYLRRISGRSIDVLPTPPQRARARMADQAAIEQEQLADAAVRRDEYPLLPELRSSLQRGHPIAFESGHHFS